MSRWIALLAALAVPASVHAECVQVVDATAWLPDGVREHVTLQLEGGRITAVTEGRPAGGRCRILEVNGAPVTPGLVDPLSDIGLVEVPMEAPTADNATEKPITPSSQVVDAYNPRSTLIPVARRGGVTSAVVTPVGGLVSGQAAWVVLSGATQQAAVQSRSVALHVHLRPTEHSRARELHRLQALLDEARRYHRDQEAWRRTPHRGLAVGPRELEALKPVLDGVLPVVVHTDRAAEVEAALRLAATYGLKLIIAGGAEAWLVKEGLAARQVPVILSPLVYGPGSFDQLHGRADNAVLLHRAGVPVIFGGYGGHNARALPQLAGNAVRAGLPATVALKAITETPARAFGMPDQARLAPGAVANVVVWSGDPLELTSAPVHVFVEGVQQSLESRQTRLRDRYLKAPAQPIEPLPLP